MAENRISSTTFPEEGRDEIRLRDLWQTLQRHRWLVLIVAAGVTLLAGVWTWRQDPLYISEATLRVDEHDRGASLLGDLSPSWGMRPGKIETEMAVLRSRQIREQVVDSLGLMLVLQQPKVQRDRVLRPLRVPRDARPASLELRRRSGSSYSLHVLAGPDGLRVPATVEIGVPFQVGAAELALAPALVESPPERIRFAIRSFRGAVASLRNALVVQRTDPMAHIVSVRFQGTDPQLAAAITNTLTDQFIDYKSRSSKDEARSTVAFLREQVASYTAQLAEAENRLRGFREREQVVSPQEEASQQVRRLAELRAEYDRLRGEREALGKLLEQATRAPARENESSPYRQLASFPVFFSNRTVQDMLQSLTELENERAKLLVRRTPENDEVDGFTRRIREMEMQLYQIARNYQEGLDSQLASHETNVARFATEIQAIPSREVEFARLSREQQLVAEIYNLLQTQLKEAEIREAVESTDVRIIDTALVPDRPVSPRPMRNLALAAMLGLFLGVCLALARETLDTRVHTREDLSEATNGAPVLALIPRIRLDGSLVAAAQNGRNGNGANGRGGHDARGADEKLITRLQPHSPASEAYRALRTNITFASMDRAPQVLVITSAMPGDGKTTSASNLAITLAQQGTKVLLVDGDLRRGTLHHLLGAEQSPGLTHVLMGAATLEDAVQEVRSGTDAHPLYFLSSGLFPPNPAELLGSARMRDLIATLRERYEMIVFDAAPLNLVTDAALLGTVADATVLVARARTTEKRALQHAALQLSHLGANMRGVVLNDVTLEDNSRYYGYASYGYAAQGSGNT
ncbi:MAG TPA: polysaccharide biosynthesis tyrosine autokinase [Longimicrobiaceae bacterium]|nr:polysaccharide biosynthesis tyrosine autokinase [Longimicrobiaceae bacterium]